nr:DUF6473 family protein [uncultured Celeribacter sp.]
MNLETPPEENIDYAPCAYGASKLSFRGPAKVLSSPYVICLGGTETYGRFVDVPFPELVEKTSGIQTVNLGCVNAGLDVFLNDDEVLRMCMGAELVILQVPGAQNMSNRFYSVHPRRNDRFVGASALLRAIYREVDFTQFHFTRHLLSALQATCPQRFDLVRQELRDAWSARMRSLAHRFDGRLMLLWLSTHRPDEETICDSLEADPLFVNRNMLEAMKPYICDCLEIIATPADVAAGFDLLRFSGADAPAAREVFGPVVHAQTAQALCDRLPTVFS